MKRFAFIDVQNTETTKLKVQNPVLLTTLRHLNEPGSRLFSVSLKMLSIRESNSQIEILQWLQNLIAEDTL